MMMGTVPTSVPQFILLGNFLLEGRFRQKWKQVRSNSLFWIMSAAFLVHVLGLFYTTDMGAGWDDVRTKMPIMFLPLILMCAELLTAKELRLVLYCFILGCVVNTAWCLVYSFVLHSTNEVRNASRFMSHIRLGLFLNMGISVLVYLSTQSKTILEKMFHFALALYLLVTMYMMGLASGLVNFFVVVLLFVAWLLMRRGRGFRLVALSLTAVFFVFVFLYVRSIAQSQLVVKNDVNNVTAKISPGNNLYIHFDPKGQKENGYYVHMNIQLEELKRAWQRDFPADSFNYDQSHNLGRYAVLVRYMASRGLKKDSVAYLQLSTEDKKNVQAGIPNHLYNSWNFMHKRVYELVHEYDEFKCGSNVNGNSITMRFYFWKAALHLIAQSPLLGVGTGDVQKEMNRAYVETQSPLEPEWHKRPHNQLITVTVALGVTGLLVFLCSLMYPAILLRKSLHLLYWPFFTLLFFSFLSEDTLETQAGLTFFAFFNSLFVSQAYHLRNSKTPEG